MSLSEAFEGILVYSLNFSFRTFGLIIISELKLLYQGVNESVKFG